MSQNADSAVCWERVWHSDGSYHLCGRPAKFLITGRYGPEADRPLCGVHARPLQRRMRARLDAGVPPEWTITPAQIDSSRSES